MGGGLFCAYPFPVLETSDRVRYKLHGIVTNRTLPGEALIKWSRERCGKSEQVHSVLKEDLAGGKLPTGDFGPNAAWWAIAVLAYNLNSAMKRLALGESWIPKRLKAIRFQLICVAGRVLSHARDLIIRLAAGHPSFDWLLAARRRMLCLFNGAG
ncbi:MAG: transposase [Armatimonadetes bacterium]|nr:transposase [Armatimonadota bacterium]